MQKRFSLNQKILLLVTLSVLFSFLLLGINFDLFLKNKDFLINEKRIIHTYKRLVANITEKSTSLIESVLFNSTDESLLASINLVNNYQDKKNYNAILLDEEKKDIVNKLLYKVKFSFNKNIALYDKNFELIAYVTKIDDIYQLNFLSYENGKRVLFQKYENDKQFKKIPFKPEKLIHLFHDKYNTPTKTNNQKSSLIQNRLK